MYGHQMFLCFVFVLIVTRAHSVDINDTDVFEELIGKLEHIQYKLIEMEFAMKEDRESIDQKLSGAISQLVQTIGYNLTTLQAQSNKILSQQAVCANHEQMRKEIEAIGSNQDQLPARSDSILWKRPIRSCKDESAKQSGKYLLQPTENGELFLGYCEQVSFGGGWLVIQHRYNGMEDFDRNWTDYRNGFGSIGGEFWLGLERLHLVTSARKHELLVELKDFSGEYKYARYNATEIGSELEQYPLMLGSYIGTAGDSLNYHNNMKFTTMDRDNDNKKDVNCARPDRGGWWFNECYTANLNGRYKNIKNTNSINWYDFKSDFVGLAYSRMLIRET
ncbi:fibrinogen-like protein A [Anopheles arabiensis]|uniref:Fibrinogen C-terminal domain-containing protein n=1 Tax=Anopheles arabiensis TaxID=7173 RepID=A0A8W7LNB9_ANOAR|nr:fibrinogen-like protein A [Anopheles arabiensis]